MIVRRLLPAFLVALAVVPLHDRPAASAPVLKKSATADACANWPMYGANPQRTFAADCPSGIDAQSVARLVPAWVFDTPKPVTASPTVVDGVVYVGAWDGVMYALDAVSGSVRWRFQTPPAPGATYGPIVSSAAVGDVAITNKLTQRLVVFGAGPLVYALRASDGSVVWRHDASRGIAATPTEYESSPVIVDDLVIVGRDTHNEGVAETGGIRGGVVALRAATGEQVWLFEPELDRVGSGCGGVWGSPTISPDKSTVFFGSANCPRDEFDWTPHTNAVTALQLRSGKPIWAFQPTGKPDQDTDFGATPNYFVDKNGRAVLGAGKKDGTYYALHPSTGKELWRRKVVEPAPNIGGFIGSPAIGQGNVFGGTAIGSPPFFHSLDGATGAVRFQGGAGPTYGASAVVNDVVFNAALDDLLKAYDLNTGRLLWSTPLSGPGSSGPAIAGDMVFIGAGTSTSDACAKDSFYDAQCKLLFDTALATLGGVHAYRLANPANPLAVGSRVAAQSSGVEVVLNGEDNRLNAYDATTGKKRTLIKSAGDDKTAGLDINAEICAVPDGVPWKPDGERWFIAGEDTEQNSEPGVIKQGWGIFRLEGATLESMTATQIGKLVPDSFVTAADNPENYGCGVLPDGRVVTGDVGDQLPQDPATGQLIEWFVRAEHLRHVGPDRNDFARVPHCKIDVSLGTAGGIEVDATTVLIASNRPNLEAAQPGGIYRYDTSVWPTGETAAAGCGRQDATGQQLADAGRVGRSLFTPQVPGLLTTPSDIVHSGRGTYFISSVFTGQVAEYDKAGVFRRFVVNTTGQVGGITPFGLGVTRDGTLWIADIGVVGPGPSPDAGSVVRVRFDADDQPLGLETIDEGLQYPDGIGVIVLAQGRPSGGTQRPRLTALPRTGPTPTPVLFVATAAALVAVVRRRSSQTVHTQG